MNDPRYKELVETSWRRPLTEAEEAQLRTVLQRKPEAQEEWELECALTEALRRLPTAPVSSNFTARVLQEIERQQGSPKVGRGMPWPIWPSLRWFSRFAFATLVVGTGLFSYNESRIVHRQALIKSVETVSQVAASLPSPVILQDFDAIRASHGAPAADEQLLALLQ